MANKKQNPISKIIYLFATFTFFVITNWYLSDLIIEKIMRGWQISNNLISLNYIKNTGAAFNILQDATYILIGLSVAALIILFSYVIKHSKTMTFVGIFWLSVLMSGIFCNLIERIYFGYVRDYIELMFIDFPIFNISDIFINVGVAAIIILLLKRAQLKQL